VVIFILHTNRYLLDFVKLTKVRFEYLSIGYTRLDIIIHNNNILSNNR
jgi:hypothetical protein